MEGKSGGGESAASVSAQRMTLYVITAAMAGGAATAAAVLFVLADRQAEETGLLLRVLLPAVAFGAAFMGGVVVPRVLWSQGRASTADPGAARSGDNPYASFGQQRAEVTGEVLQRFQVAHIVRLASFEGAALLMSVGYFLDPHPLYLALCVAFIALILISWPTDARIRAWARG